MPITSSGHKVDFSILTGFGLYEQVTFQKPIKKGQSVNFKQLSSEVDPRGLKSNQFIEDLIKLCQSSI